MKRTLEWALFAVFAAGAAWLGVRFGRTFRGTAFPPGFLPAALLLVFLCPLIHELGHWLAGWMAGFEFQQLILGPLRWRRERDGIRLGRNPAWSLAGGAVVMLPVGGHDLRTRMLWLAAGGPLGSFGFFALCWLLAPHTGPWQPLWRFAGVVSAGLGVLTLVPSTFGHLTSDGLRIWQFARRTPAAERFARLLALFGEIQAGRQPHEWNPTWIRDFATDPGDSPDAASALSFAYTWHLDRGETAEAAALLARMMLHLPHYPGQVRGNLEYESAWFAARFTGDHAAAERHFANAQSLPSSKLSRLRATAALAALRGDHALATHTTQQALDALADEELPGTRPLMERLLRPAIQY